MITGQPEGRFDKVIDEQMCGLYIADLVEATTETETVHIWKPPQAKNVKKAEDKATIKSTETDDVEKAVRAYKRGGSLYFTSSADFRAIYGKALSYQMGFDFAGYFPGTSDGASAGDTIAEIEIFISRKGNYTDFHTDFQENFTFQLKGSKKWRLKTEKGMQAPVLGFSPHYAQANNIEG